MLFTCSYCGKEFKQSPANRRLAKTFCSRKCYHDSTKQSRDRVCEYCGKTFQVKKAIKAKFCSRECVCAKRRNSEKNVTLGKDGYRNIWLSDGSSKKEHIDIMERHIGRKLYDNEVVHHKDHNRSNNNINNLVLMTKSEHSSLHRREELALKQMPFNSKNMKSYAKGKKGELELMHILRDEYGYKSVSRGYVWNHQADLYGLDSVHIEVKRIEKIVIAKWYKQSLAASNFFKDGIPTVWHRQNKRRWLVTLSYSDWKAMGGYDILFDNRRAFNLSDEAEESPIRYKRQEYELVTMPLSLFMDMYTSYNSDVEVHGETK